MKQRKQYTDYRTQHRTHTYITEVSPLCQNSKSIVFVKRNTFPPKTLFPSQIKEHRFRTVPRTMKGTKVQESYAFYPSSSLKPASDESESVSEKRERGPRSHPTAFISISTHPPYPPSPSPKSLTPTQPLFPSPPLPSPPVPFSLQRT